MPHPGNYAAALEALMQARRWQDAVTWAGRWLAEDPDCALAHTYAAWGLVHLGRLDEAETHARAAVQADPEEVETLRVLSRVLAKRQRWGEARDVLQAALAIQPDNARLHSHLSHVLLQQGRMAAGLDEMRRARELDPDDANYQHQVIVLEKLGKSWPTEAWDKISRLKQTLSLDPENASILNEIGCTYLYGLEDHETAQDYLRQALLIDPTNSGFQDDLFEAVTRGDLVYRTLSLPGRFLRRMSQWPTEPGFGRVLAVLLVGSCVSIPLLVAVAASALLVYPTTRLYHWFFFSDLAAARLRHSRFVPLVRILGRTPRWLSALVLIAVSISLGVTAFALCGISQAVGWILLAAVLAASGWVTLWRHTSWREQAELLGQVTDGEPVWAELAADDLAVVVAEAVGRTPSVGRPKESRYTSRRRKLVLAALLGAASAAVACCSGIGYLGVRLAFAHEADKLVRLVGDHPIVRDNLGGISVCEVNLWADLNDSDRRRHVFDVRGPKGRGQLVTQERFYRYVSIKLHVEGDEWELLPETEVLDVRR